MSTHETHREPCAWHDAAIRSFAHNGNVGAAAKSAGVSRRMFYKAIRQNAVFADRVAKAYREFNARLLDGLGRDVSIRFAIDDMGIHPNTFFNALRQDRAFARRVYRSEAFEWPRLNRAIPEHPPEVSGVHTVYVLGAQGRGSENEVPTDKGVAQIPALMLNVPKPRGAWHDAAIAALSEGKDFTRAAAAAGVSRRMLYKAIHSPGRFADRYASLRLAQDRGGEGAKNSGSAPAETPSQTESCRKIQGKNDGLSGALFLADNQE